MQILFARFWDIIQGKEEEYAKNVSELLSQTQSIGLKAVGGYYVEVGSGPRIAALAAQTDLSELACILSQTEYRDTTLRFKSLVCNFSTAVLEPVGRFKEKEYAIQKGVWKLNMGYDMKPGTHKDQADSIVEEYITMLGNVPYMEVTGAWNVVLGGMNEYVAELTFSDPTDIGKFLKDEDFRKTTHKMRSEYVVNYSSRILRCTERFDEPRWFRL
jgi:hypothetical protein